MEELSSVKDTSDVGELLSREETSVADGVSSVEGTSVVELSSMEFPSVPETLS